jgi:hypothetical protein
MCKIFQSFILVCFVVLFSWSCKRVRPEAPERSTLDSTLQIPTSELRIPISYDVKKLESWLNAKISGTFVNQRFQVNESGDSLWLKVQKVKPFTLKWRQGVLYYDLPLAMEATYYKRVGRLSIHNPEPLKTELVLKVASWIDLDKDWNLVTSSEIRDIHWVKEPSVQVGRFKFNLSKQVNKILNERKDTLVSMLDRAAFEQIDLKKVIDKLWSDIQKPIYLHKNDPEVFLKNRASSIYGRLVRENTREITMDLMLKSYAVASLDESLLPATNPQLPAFVAMQPEHADFKIAIHGIMTYADINKNVNKFLKDQEVTVKGYSAKIKDIELYGSGQELVVKIDVKGDIKGSLFAIGELNFDVAEKVFSIHNFRYDIDTEDQLVRTAAIFLKDRIMEEVQKHLQYSMRQQLDDLPQLIATAIAEGKAGETISLQIDALDVTGWQSLITGSNIQFIIAAAGKADLRLEQLKKGKELKIGP